jgi:hypothetical protein
MMYMGDTDGDGKISLQEFEVRLSRHATIAAASMAHRIARMMS